TPRGVQQKRQMRGDQLAVDLRDERAEAMRSNEVVKDVESGFAERRWNVHADLIPASPKMGQDLVRQDVDGFERIGPERRAEAEVGGAEGYQVFEPRDQLIGRAGHAEP